MPLPYILIANCTKVEFATLGRTKEGKAYHHLWTAPEITELLRKHGLAKPETTSVEDK